MLSSKPSSCSDIIDQTPKPLILRAKTVEINKEFKKFLHSPKTINEFKFSNNINKYNNNNKQINVFDTYSPLKQNKLNDKINLIKNFTFDSNESSLLSISENSSSILSTPPSNKNKIIKMPNNEKKKRFVRKYISPPNSKNSNKINEDNNKNKNKLFTSLFEINDNSPFNEIININQNNNNLSSLFYEHCENPEKNNIYTNNIFDKINNIINQINEKKFHNKFNIYIIKEDCSIEDIEYEKFINNLYDVNIYEKEGILSQDNKFYIPANIKCDLNFINIKNDVFEGRLIFQIINNNNFAIKNNFINNKTILNDNNYNYDLLCNDIISNVELFSMEIQLF
jgi:hypothetical protein